MVVIAILAKASASIEIMSAPSDGDREGGTQSYANQAPL